jgi:hypothetical protein
MVRDGRGGTLLHWAVQREAVGCVDELLRLFSATDAGATSLPSSQQPPVTSVEWILNGDNRIVTPLHWAARLDSSKILKVKKFY